MPMIPKGDYPEAPQPTAAYPQKQGHCRPLSRLCKKTPVAEDHKGLQSLDALECRKSPSVELSRYKD